MKRAKKKAPVESLIRYRRNRQIRVPEVVLIDDKNVNHGTIPTSQALDMAMDAELDLVEVAPNSQPPVVRILDYSKFVYEKKRREREARKNQKKVEMKTIKLTLNTAEFHRGIQVRKAHGWLVESKKVKVEIRFQGREVSYPEIAHKIMVEVYEELKDVCTVEQRPIMEGRTMNMMLAPTAAKP